MTVLGEYSWEGKAGVQPGPSRDPTEETALDLRNVRPFPPEMALITLSSQGLGRLQRQQTGGDPYSRAVSLDRALL